MSMPVGAYWKGKVRSVISPRSYCMMAAPARMSASCRREEMIRKTVNFDTVIDDLERRNRRTC